MSKGAVVRFSKADMTTLEKLDSFLDAESPELAEFLTRTWDDQQHAITYSELRNAIMHGEFDMSYMVQWQQDYSRFVVDHYAPIAERAIRASARELSVKYGGMISDPQMQTMQQFIDTRGGRLIRQVTATQYQAVNTLVRQAAMTGGRTVDELARAIRPCVGLTARQSQATYNYYNFMRDRYYDEYINAGKSEKAAATAASKRALQRQATYAEMTHRNRAQTIAQTELAYAYNNGADMAVRDAQQEGMLGASKKRWLTAVDERVCKQCGALHDTVVGMDEAFNGGISIPPAHPRCRCAVAYECEVADLAQRWDNAVERVNRVNQEEYETRLLDQQGVAGYNESAPEPVSITDDFKRAADNRYFKAIENEQEITSQVSEIAENHGMDTVGLQYRVKGFDSYARKTLTEETGYRKINDILRYTYTTDGDSLSTKTISVLNDYSERGFTVSKVKNTWFSTTNPYRGINTQIVSPNGQVFELQFHTPQSFAAKDGEMHKLYEQYRVLDSTSQKAKALSARMFKLSDALDVPKDIDKVVGALWNL